MKYWSWQVVHVIISLFYFSVPHLWFLVSLFSWWYWVFHSVLLMCMIDPGFLLFKDSDQKSSGAATHFHHQFIETDSIREKQWKSLFWDFKASLCQGKEILSVSRAVPIVRRWVKKLYKTRNALKLEKY